MILAAAGFTAFGILIGTLITERLWWLLSRPLPRPWRAYARLWRDVRRLLETGRLT